MKRNIVTSALVTGLLLGSGACSQQATPPVKPYVLFNPTASIQEIMASIVDPNADDVWNAVASINTAAGTVDKQPHTDDEWKAVRRHAITLLEATNLLLIEGRRVSAEGSSTSASPAEWGPKEIQHAIDTQRPDFIKHAHDLHDAVQQAIEAIDAKNPEELVKTGGVIDQVCEQCHKQFWYPNDKLPPVPARPSLEPRKS